MGSDKPSVKTSDITFVTILVLQDFEATTKSSRCPRKPISSSPSPSLPSSSSRRPLASWILTRMVFCLPQIFRQLLLLMARTLVVAKPRPCLTKLMDPCTSPRWSPSLPPRWLVAQMTMMLSLHPLKLLRWTAKLMPKHSDTASEVDDAFAEFKIDEGMIDGAHLKGLMVSK